MLSTEGTLDWTRIYWMYINQGRVPWIEQGYTMPHTAVLPLNYTHLKSSIISKIKISYILKTNIYQKIYLFFSGRPPPQKKFFLKKFFKKTLGQKKKFFKKARRAEGRVREGTFKKYFLTFYKGSPPTTVRVQKCKAFKK